MTRSALLLAVLSAVALGCSGTTNPCTGDACPQVAGLYEATFTPQMKCSLWAPHAPPLFNLTVQQSGSSVTMLVQPGPDSPVHTFTGTINANGAWGGSEPVPMAGLNVAYASVHGTFTVGATLGFNGLLILNPPLGGGSTSAGGGQDMCSGTYTLAAQGQGGGMTSTSASSGSGSSSGSSGSTSASTSSTTGTTTGANTTGTTGTGTTTGTTGSTGTT